MSTATAPATSSGSTRVTLRTLRKRVTNGEPIPMLTCYDATTARWLFEGGVDTILVGDTAAQMILGYDSTLPAPMDFMVTLTAAVRRGAPHAFIMADMPFGSYQCGDDEALRNAVRFLKEADADCVKLEVDATHADLVGRMAAAGIPVVAHLGSRPQQIRAKGGYRSEGKTQREADIIVEAADLMLARGASMLLVEAVPAEVSRRVVDAAEKFRERAIVPVIGCGAGPACHGHVVVLHDLLGLTDWQPPFIQPMAELGASIVEAAARWRTHVVEGEYLKDGGPYRSIG